MNVFDAYQIQGEDTCLKMFPVGNYWRSTLGRTCRGSYVRLGESGKIGLGDMVPRGICRTVVTGYVGLY
jgi:hypothetical protein